MIKKASIVLIILFIFCGASQAKIVSDQLNRRVTAPDNPQRIISFAPNVTEIIFALKQESRLVGAVAFSDYPKAAEKIPRVGSYIHLDIEKILSLKPDLCIAIKEGNPKAIIDKLDRCNVPVYAVNPKSLESVIDAVIQIGSLLNAEKTAALLTDNMRRRINRIKSITAKAKLKPKVFFQIDANTIISAGSDTFIHQLIVAAGGINLAQSQTSYPTFNREQVLSMSPDIIIIAAMEKGKKGGAFQKAKDKWSYFSIPAAVNNKIFFVNADLFNRPSPRLVEGLEKLFTILHPENHE